MFENGDSKTITPVENPALTLNCQWVWNFFLLFLKKVQE